MSGPRQLRLDVNINLYGQDGTRLGIQEATDLEEMDFHQLSKLLEAFHIITEAVKAGRNVNINGQEMRYLR
jgi:hypothetical protein